MRLLRRTASLLAGCLLTGAPLLAGSVTDAWSTASATGVPMTRVRLHVDRCVHCPVRLVQAVLRPGHGARVWRTGAQRVRNGWVTFSVPTRRTEGMSIEVDPRWSTLEAVSNVVFRYAHTALGQRIDPATARHKDHAEGCWAGTEASKVTLQVRVVRFPTVDSDGHHGFAPRAWLARSHPALRPMVQAFKGAIGNQDAFYCTR